MKRIGITSENFQYESKAYQLLFENTFKNEVAQRIVSFHPMLKNIGTGYSNRERVKKLLKSELIEHPKDVVILCRDLDGLPSEVSKIAERQKWFDDVEKNVDACTCLFFLAIYELEALFLADIEGFSKWCGKNFKIKYTANPQFKEKPKEFLIEKSKGKYEESKAVDVINNLNVNTIIERHDNFKDLMNNIVKIIAPPQ